MGSQNWSRRRGAYSYLAVSGREANAASNARSSTGDTPRIGSTTIIALAKYYARSSMGQSSGRDGVNITDVAYFVGELHVLGGVADRAVSSMVSWRSAAARIVGSVMPPSLGEGGSIFDEINDLAEATERPGIDGRAG